ncbi:MAG: TetR/AcrR family transcriptional regulator [Gammaproteobacteria bacterium]|nr:TetR/AcrR family transcriptional regulator [Gammaproteobacteria bacterium]MDH5803420.1 TetR/AcrR family transcriptional regulator [Gammaproteobacteria bacterium]
MTEFGKRELNKARTRLNILNAVYELSSTVNFRDLKVMRIAESVGITEMTFFNYFQKKEDILKYMMGHWGLNLLYLQRQAPLAGEAAIRRLFAHTAGLVNKHPRLLASFVASLLSNEIEPHAMEIEGADRYLRYPDAPDLYEIRIPTGNDTILQHLAEIESDKDHTATLLHLASSFYGDVILAHTAGLDLEQLYENSLDMIFANPYP